MGCSRGRWTSDEPAWRLCGVWNQRWRVWCPTEVPTAHTVTAGAGAAGAAAVEGLEGVGGVEGWGGLEGLEGLEGVEGEQG